MKHLSKLPLAGTLLVSYTVYSLFASVSIAHSIILFSLAAFTAYDRYLVSVKNPSNLKLITDIKEDIERKLAQQGELHESKLQELKEEFSKQQIAKINASSASLPKKPTIQF